MIPTRSMLTFELIPEEDFEEYREYALKSWRNDMANAGLVEEDVTQEEAEKQIMRFVPQGFMTPGHYFFYAMDGVRRVGKLWVVLREKRNPEAFLWYLYIEEEFGGQGYGKKSMELINDFARMKGAIRISLNVFPNNSVARNLHSKMCTGRLP